MTQQNTRVYPIDNFVYKKCTVYIEFVFSPLRVVHFLATLYADGETTYEIENDEKITNVIVNRTKYKLSPEALTTFENVHDDWEMNVCKKYPYEPLIGGKIHMAMFKNNQVNDIL